MTYPDPARPLVRLAKKFTDELVGEYSDAIDRAARRADREELERLQGDLRKRLKLRLQLCGGLPVPLERYERVRLGLEK